MKDVYVRSKNTFVSFFSTWQQFVSDMKNYTLLRPADEHWEGGGCALTATAEIKPGVETLLVEC
jgi:hypothetical protein